LGELGESPRKRISAAYGEERDLPEEDRQERGTSGTVRKNKDREKGDSNYPSKKEAKAEKTLHRTLREKKSLGTEGKGRVSDNVGSTARGGATPC